VLRLALFINNFYHASNGFAVGVININPSVNIAEKVSICDVLYESNSGVFDFSFNSFYPCLRA
jgi:hypothetical protein